MWVYKQTERAGTDGAEKHLWTVGFYTPDGKEFYSDSDHTSQDAARARVSYLNGGKAG